MLQLTNPSFDAERGGWNPVRALLPGATIKDSPMNPESLSRFAPQMLSILRIVVALLFIAHGTQKLFGFPPAQFPSPSLFSLMGVAGILEVVGGLAILLGFL